jgi:hypothetical protein
MRYVIAALVFAVLMFDVYPDFGGVPMTVAHVQER